MKEIPSYSLSGEEVGRIGLPEEIFDIEPNQGALHAYFNVYLYNQGQGTAATKGRSQLKGGGAKPWRQKGTGRARAGTSNSPIWVGGGRVFGPSPRPRHREVPKKVRRLALKSALSLLAKRDAILGLEETKVDPPKTRIFAAFLSKVGLQDKRGLLLVRSSDQNLTRSTSNLPGLKLRRATDVNAYDLLNSDFLILTEESVTALREVLQ